MTGVEVLVIAVAAGVGAALSSFAGIGGGLLLLSVMLGFMDPLEAIPVHSVLQLVSNSTRTITLRESVETTVVKPFALLLLPGTIAGLAVAGTLPRSVGQLVIAAFALLAGWWPAALDASTRILGDGRRTFVALGAISGFLQMTVGAVGPVVAPVIRREMGDRTRTVATFSACQAMAHVLKLTLFAIVGFAFGDWWTVILVGAATTIVGTHIGSRLLRRQSERVFGWVFRLALTVVAVRVIIIAI
ncbi:MAG TPA: hypothetical protein DEP66_05180 [Acidimicrobiaceae bacterium]|nr:hypothetical protein [Acidimicrobiaceae bacterium]HCB37588.1 hypothetical protein [Acidimicrobiaceae bacterium]